MRPPLEVLLYFLGHEGRDEILRHYRRDSCLASTRIGIEFLRHFGYTARPLAVRVEIANAEMLRCQAEGIPDDQALEQGAWVVGIDGSDVIEGSGWDGHLVFTVEGYVMDLSLDQASRPAKGIELSPLLAEIPPHWPQKPMGWMMNGSLVAYQEFGRTSRFRQTNDWRRESAWAPIVGKLVRNFKKYSETFAKAAPITYRQPQ